jgi:hypothetical protein
LIPAEPCRGDGVTLGKWFDIPTFHFVAFAYGCTTPSRESFFPLNWFGGDDSGCFNRQDAFLANVRSFGIRRRKLARVDAEV